MLNVLKILNVHSVQIGCSSHAGQHHIAGMGPTQAEIGGQIAPDGWSVSGCCLMQSSNCHLPELVTQSWLI